MLAIRKVRQGVDWQTVFFCWCQLILSQSNKIDNMHLFKHVIILYLPAYGDHNLRGNESKAQARRNPSIKNEGEF